MTPTSVARPLRVLLLAADAGEARLLETLLASLPQCPVTVVNGTAADAAAAGFDWCLLSLAHGPDPLGETLPALRLHAPRIRVCGVIGTTARSGDRVALARALRGGLDDLYVLEDLSVSALLALLDADAAAPPVPALPARVAPPAAPRALAAPVPLAGGAWEIVLGSQRAGFDADTLAALGYAPGEIGSGIGDWKSLIHPEDTDRLVQEVHNVLSGAAPPHPVGYRVRHASGAWLAVVSDDIRVQLDANGAPHAISGRFYAAEDVPAAPPAAGAGTAAGADEAPVRASRRIEDELAQYLARSLPLASFLVDERGRVLRCVSVGDGTFGASSEALEERSLAELFGAGPGTQCLEQVVRTLNTGTICSGIYRGEREFEPFWIECHTSVLRTRPGMPQRVILCAENVTRRMHQAGAAQAMRDQLRETLRQIPFALALKDLDGRYQLVNAGFEQLFGVAATVLLGKTDHEVFPDALAGELQEAQRIILESGSAFSELRAAGQGERRAARHGFHFPVRDPDGQTVSTGSLWIDPAELPAAAVPPAAAAVTRIEDARAALRDDIGNATASVVGRVEEALAEAGDYVDVLRQLEHLVETSLHAQSLLHQIAGREDDGDELRSIVVSPLVADIVELEKILLPAGARLENAIAEDLPSVQCDAVSFHRILLRAIRHARRGLGADGTLRIGLRTAAAAGIACTGCGMPVDGGHIELAVSRSDAAEQGLPVGDIADVFGDLAEIQSLVHSQGGHLRAGTPAGGAAPLLIYLRAGSGTGTDEEQRRPRSTVARFPLERTTQKTTT